MVAKLLRLSINTVQSLKMLRLGSIRMDSVKSEPCIKGNYKKELQENGHFPIIPCKIPL